MNNCDLVQFNYKTKTLRIDRVRYDIDLFRLIYKLLAPVAAKARVERSFKVDPEDAHIDPMDVHDVKDLKDEIQDTLKTHVRRLL